MPRPVSHPLFFALSPRVLARSFRFLVRQSTYEQHASVPVLISHSGLHIPGRSFARSTVTYMQQSVGACRPSSPKAPEPPAVFCIIPAGPGSGVSFPCATKHIRTARFLSCTVFTQRSPYPGPLIIPLHSCL